MTLIWGSRVEDRKAEVGSKWQQVLGKPLGAGDLTPTLVGVRPCELVVLIVKIDVLGYVRSTSL